MTPSNLSYLVRFSCIFTEFDKYWIRILIRSNGALHLLTRTQFLTPSCFLLPFLTYTKSRIFTYKQAIIHTTYEQTEIYTNWRQKHQQLEYPGRIDVTWGYSRLHDACTHVKTVYPSTYNASL